MGKIMKRKKTFGILFFYFTSSITSFLAAQAVEGTWGKYSGIDTGVLNPPLDSYQANSNKSYLFSFYFKRFFTEKNKARWGVNLWVAETKIADKEQIEKTERHNLLLTLNLIRQWKLKKRGVGIPVVAASGGIAFLASRFEYDLYNTSNPDRWFTKKLCIRTGFSYLIPVNSDIAIQLQSNYTIFIPPIEKYPFKHGVFWGLGLYLEL